MSEIRVGEYRVPKGLLYTDKHHWVKVEGDRARIGITDYAQRKLKDVVYIELPSVDDELVRGESYGVVESIKAAEDLYAPLSGRVIEVNEEVISNTSLINEDPYGRGWLLVVEIAKPEEVDELLRPEEYAELLKREAK
ncbi:MAG: glycine cleavage system protein GcvH [Thermoprotei archaeon]|nr:MAG: glycine cleavage system protein GcvH [Thermoprotei archaeon]